MQAMKQQLISFFVQVAQKDKAILKKLKREQSFIVEQKRWCFTLQDLHLFLQQQEGLFLSIEYRQFRQLIFNSPVNKVTRQYGAEITFAENRKKVDLSIYALVWPHQKNDRS